MNPPPQIHPTFSWTQIDTSCLIWMAPSLINTSTIFLGRICAQDLWEQNRMTSDQARKELLKRYQAVENTLQWTDLDYWSEQLGLDIPELKCKVDHLIQVHPFVVDFLQFVRKIGKKVHLVTNAHSKTLEIKCARPPSGVGLIGLSAPKR